MYVLGKKPSVKIRIIMWTLSFSTKRRRFISGMILLSAYMQLQCCTSKQNTNNVKSESSIVSNNNEDVRTGNLQLELRSSRNKLAPGDCADLHLDAINNSTRAIHWGADWVLEQDVPFPLPPETFIRGTRELSAGRTSDLVNFRMCHKPDAHLIAGVYRLRISTALASAEPVRSNWVSIQVLL